MDPMKLLSRIDARTAQAFVRATRNLFDAMLVEAERVQSTATPQPRDYQAAGLSREMPAGGWLSYEELHAVTRKLTESLAAEKWLDGVMFAVRTLALLGAI